jgi:hypothetical protein
MPVASFRCPGCGVALTSAAAFRCGKVVDCPKCQLLFTPFEDDLRTAPVVPREQSTDNDIPEPRPSAVSRLTIVLLPVVMLLVAAAVGGGIIALLKKKPVVASVKPARTAPVTRQAIEREDEPKAPPKSAQIEPVATMYATALWEDYGRNALATDAKYKGKYVEFSAQIGAIQKGEDGRYFIGVWVLQYLSPRQAQLYPEGIPPNIICYLSPEARDDFLNAKIGSSMRFIAKVVGSKPANVWRGYILELEYARATPGSPKL